MPYLHWGSRTKTLKSLNLHTVSMRRAMNCSGSV